MLAIDSVGTMTINRQREPWVWTLAGELQETDNGKRGSRHCQDNDGQLTTEILGLDNDGTVTGMLGPDSGNPSECEELNLVVLGLLRDPMGDP